MPVPGGRRRRFSSGLLLPLVLVLVGGAVLVLHLRVFRGDPITTDENSYLFQARIFAAGHLWAPPPPEGRLIDFDFSMINRTEDRWFSRYPFAHPLTLVPGVWLGAPWLMPWLMALASVWATHALARRLYDLTTANVAAVLMGASPFFLAMHATLLSHTTALVALSLCFLASVKAFESHDYRWGVLAGACAGLAFNARPFTAILMTWPLGVWGLRIWFRDRSPAVRNQLACIVGAGLVPVGLYVLYGWALTGDWRLSPYALYNPTERLGFVYVQMAEMQHTPAQALAQTMDNLARLNVSWLGVPGALWLLLLLAWQRLKAADAVLFLSGASLVVGYAFFYFPGIPTIGPMYYFEALLPLSVLGARSVLGACDVAVEMLRSVRGGRALVAGGAIAALVLWTAALGSFWNELARSIEETLKPQRSLAAAVDSQPMDGAIVFMAGRTRPEWRAVRYDPFGERNPVYMWTRGDRHTRIMALYPDRPAYLYDDDSQLTRLR